MNGTPRGGPFSGTSGTMVNTRRGVFPSCGVVSTAPLERSAGVSRVGPGAVGHRGWGPGGGRDLRAHRVPTRVGSTVRPGRRAFRCVSAEDIHMGVETWVWIASLVVLVGILVVDLM